MAKSGPVFVQPAAKKKSVLHCKMVEKISKADILRHVKMVRNSSFCVHKNSFMFLTQPCPFVYILSTAAFALQRQSWVVATETLLVQNLKFLVPERPEGFSIEGLRN